MRFSGALKLTLVRPVPDVIDIPGPNGTVMRGHPEKYRRFTAALEHRPHTVAELLALPVPAEHRPIARVGSSFPVGNGLALPCYDGTPKLARPVRGSTG